MAREEGKGGVSNFEKRHNTDLSLFSFQIHFAPLLRTVLCFLYFLKRETTKKIIYTTRLSRFDKTRIQSETKPYKLFSKPSKFEINK